MIHTSLIKYKYNTPCLSYDLFLVILEYLKMMREWLLKLYVFDMEYLRIYFIYFNFFPVNKPLVSNKKELILLIVINVLTIINSLILNAQRRRRSIPRCVITWIIMSVCLRGLRLSRLIGDRRLKISFLVLSPRFSSVKKTRLKISR
ncbi:hypothetical protein BpHYR1_022225 [Brachionus plicatilis]|uniref:Uncharacterized protein n=1 Tax=Brachionus plicatilis TaxID=10195 RepID=A0A3M7QJC8_BRAPC|nr:hypothetical protein BpHYR1_022225 [Brachionus plicatilis]